MKVKFEKLDNQKVEEKEPSRSGTVAHKSQRVDYE